MCDATDLQVQLQMFKNRKAVKTMSSHCALLKLELEEKVRVISGALTGAVEGEGPNRLKEAEQPMEVKKEV
ncbi:uncharacterized protein MONOS_7374 [Monocercomonoides exilis]|uniref:uncharacterized protein n=1 Tax=Monocercomonoides exilis TaxID=2049356 RepID=UPI003559581C|nr:hypothetical protein MONOS_7374 [Monocercomonoides exilis]|eukprot:MONOS_7374.1-p1 / transcript=MONOS_7374.1 / gene=MONOS_7374 / organism=Monocercomonoides_exilis_PA203 / gene_product=unspecified product / transcript_product=unspecified product / location=Mono_scaffold00250:42002-42214(+) / protein_length=71 / sequence_SO=supercontig / SO=protein_coding / is_pseudo=false